MHLLKGLKLLKRHEINYSLRQSDLLSDFRCLEEKFFKKCIDCILQLLTFHVYFSEISRCHAWLERDCHLKSAARNIPRSALWTFTTIYRC
jgi:hypothetical protein